MEESVKKIIKIPEFCLVLLMGTSSSGKSTFAGKHFKRTEIISSDNCRAIVCDDENNQEANSDAFSLMSFVLEKRLKNLKLTIIDATNVKNESRAPLLALAKKYHCPTVLIILNTPVQIAMDRHNNRSDRYFTPDIINQHSHDLKMSINGLKKEGFMNIYELNSTEEINSVEIERQPLPNNLRQEHGPFDIIGDIHGCFTELKNLLTLMDYRVKASGPDEYKVSHPEGRKVIFLGDLVDRGPDTPGVLKLAISMVKSGNAFCVSGNHDLKLMKKLKGSKIILNHGLSESLEQIEKEPACFKNEIVSFIGSLESNYVMDGGNLVVAHAGLTEELHGRSSGKVNYFALYGETTGETDEFGLPVRSDWAAEYRGKPLVAYGHTPVPEPELFNNTICIDTGCVFGGRLTALRYPEKEIVSVPAEKVYFEPVKHFLAKRKNAG